VQSVTIVVLIGIPGSGKSSLARFLLAQWRSCCYISSDAIRAQLYGDAQIQGDWLMIEAQILWQANRAAQLGDRSPIPAALYDATNCHPENRAVMIAHLRKCGFTKILGVWLNLPLAICLQRNQERDRRVSPAVISAMHQMLQQSPPRRTEGFDRLIVGQWQARAGLQFEEFEDQERLN